MPKKTLYSQDVSPLRRVDLDLKRMIGMLNTISADHADHLRLTDEMKDYISQHNFITYKLSSLLKAHSEVLKSQLRNTATTADKERELLDKYPDL